MKQTGKNIMNKSRLLATAFTTAVLSFSGANAEVPEEMEKCQVVDASGRGLIKEHKTDCASKDSSCAGTNANGDPEAWIIVPKGECDKINQGDFSGVSDEIKDKIEMKNETPENETSNS